MPPRFENKNNGERKFASSRDAVNWYRSFGQEEISTSEKPQLLSALRIIVENDPYGSFSRKEDDSQPFLLDAASMLVDVSGMSESESEKEGYLKTARGMLNTLVNSSEQPVNVRVDALKYLDDIEFKTLIGAYSSNEVSDEQINEVWNDKCIDSLNRFNKAAEQFDGNDGFQLGSFLEWFWLLGNRYMKVDRRHPELSRTATYTRAALTREDRAHYGDDHRLSGNFDVAYEVHEKNKVRLVRKVQLKARNFDKKDEYDSSIEVIYRPSGSGEDNLMEQMLKGAQAMKRELISRKNRKISLSAEEWSAINRAEKLVAIE